MSFSSYEFVLVFLPVTVLGFWRLRQQVGRNAAVRWLIFASLVFYAYASMWGLAVILPSIGLDFFIARAMLRLNSSRARLRSALYLTGIAANILFLGYFKYKSFFLGTFDTVFGAHFALTPLLLPLGISFLTFQKIAFLSDVKSKVIETVPLQEFLIFTLFFPRTLAGPIVHYHELVPQLADPDPHELSQNVCVGIALFSIGLFKKSVLADGLASLTDYQDGGPIPLAFAWSGTLAYLFQLYFDFSGYSDMAIGAARFFGVRLPMNFNSPLKATSIIDFWSRWHITLTRFLTAYIYTPLVLHLTRSRIAQGKPILRGKRSTATAIANLVALPTLVTMGLSGLWHGAGWQFVIWGLLHGIYLTVNQAWRMLRPRFWANQRSYDAVMGPVGFLLTFFSVVVAIVFFRAESIDSALSTLGAMAGFHGVLPTHAQALRELGIHFNWIVIWEPFEAFTWLVPLSLMVTLLPNSLELLRRFRPALDFPEGEPFIDDAPGKTRLLSGLQPKSRLHLYATALGHVCMRVAGEGLTGSRLTAWLLALLTVLGLMALNHTSKFIYGQF